MPSKTKSIAQSAGPALLADEQPDMLEKSFQEQQEARASQPVECLGIKFPNDAARRAHYLELLAAKLKDPEFRKIEGFPIGKDEDILALSDPPYYTACPNPWLTKFVENHGKAYNPKSIFSREPFATDVSEGKNDPIYNAHSYHTKVPHKAIMRYILHYTEPGDLVFDGFCGTGMTGVAAQLCGNQEAISELGLNVKPDGGIFDSDGNRIATAGVRVPLLNDLSPAATLITGGYNLTKDPSGFAKFATRLLSQFDKEYGWLHKTRDVKSGEECPILYTVWSDMFLCPDCSGEIDFWGLAYEEESGTVSKEAKCPHCKTLLSKRNLVRKTKTYFDKSVGATRHCQVTRPVEIFYKHRGIEKKKTPDKVDLETVNAVEKLLESVTYPTDLMMFAAEGEKWGDLQRGYHEGISRIHDFYLPRQLATFAILWKMVELLPSVEFRRLWRFTLQGIAVSFTRRNRFLRNAYSQVNRGLSGTLYIGSTISEPSPLYVLGGKLKRFAKAIPSFDSPVSIGTGSLASINIPDNSIDYVFLDPPFGDNLPYSELNFMWEAWLKVFSNAKQDAVVSSSQDKTLFTYTDIISRCLKQAYRILKPGRWITVEFHNSQNAVWTAIQEALGRAGFIVGDVSVLDKGMKTKKQMHAKAVDKDLVISAYKPNGGLEKRFELEAGTEEGVWDFIRTHLRQLPVFIVKGGVGQIIAERQQVLLFDRMVAFHVQRGVSVPMSAGDFYQGIAQRFSERGSMYFLHEQAPEYDKKRLTVTEVQQYQLLVTDESSAIQWLKQQISKRPQTFQEIYPQFIKEIGGWQKHEKALELSELLRENFLTYDGSGGVPTQIHTYLSSNWQEFRNKAKDDVSLRLKAKDRWYVPDPNRIGDLEKLREKSLLREFEEYRNSTQKRLKVFRLEAIRVGFKKAWQEKDYPTIIAVAAKIPETVIQEDPKLLMWHSNALTRAGVDT